MNLKASDWGWALLMGAAVGWSPHTSSHVMPSIIAGVIASCITLYCCGVRRRRAGASQRPVWGRPPALFWICVAVFALLWSSAAEWLFSNWIRGIWVNPHGLFIPIVMAFLILRILRREDGSAPEASGWGFAFIAVGLSLVVVDCAIRSRFFSVLGLVICLPGFSLIFLGIRRTRAIFLPLVLALFMVPIPAEFALHLFLPQIIARGIEMMMEFAGIPVLRIGERLVLASADTVNISEHCSGFSAFQACMALAIVFSTYCRSRVRIALLLAAPWFLAVLVNLPRGLILAVACHWLGIEFLDTLWHAASGVAAFWLMAGAMFLIADHRALREGLA